MSTLLDRESLNLICLDAVNKVYDEYSDLGILVNELMMTGLRANELLDITRWTPYGNYHYDCTLLKNSGIRRFHFSDLSLDYRHYIAEQSIPGLWNYAALVHTLRKHLPVLKLENEQQNILSHIFRYNYARQLNEQGTSANTIRYIMKHSSTAITLGYLDQNIYSHP